MLRSTMLAMLAGSIALLAVVEVAEAKQRRRSSDRGYYEAARAHSVDPAGNYRGYPDWARWALSPKSRVR